MRRCLVLTISLFPMVAVAQSIVIPAGTKIIGELDQQVTSNERDFEVGDIVRGHVWRPIVVDGYTVIETGSPMLLRISEITKRKIAGRGGDVEIQAVSVRAVDGTEIFLDGGYDKQGSHRTALSASLSALVFWPAIFIRGKEAVLEPGTLFDASVPADTRVSRAPADDSDRARFTPHCRRLVRPNRRKGAGASPQSDAVCAILVT
jgi:hypothetical protein